MLLIYLHGEDADGWRPRLPRNMTHQGLLTVCGSDNSKLWLTCRNKSAENENLNLTGSRFTGKRQRDRGDLFDPEARRVRAPIARV